MWLEIRTLQKNSNQATLNWTRGRAFGYGLDALAAACGFSAIPRILSGQFGLELRALRSFNGVENRRIGTRRGNHGQEPDITEVVMPARGHCGARNP